MRKSGSHAETDNTRPGRRRPEITSAVGGALLTLVAGCGANSVNSDPTTAQVPTAVSSSAANQAPAPTSEQQPIPKGKVNTDICRFVTSERVEKAVGWPDGTISGNSCDDGSRSNVPLPAGAVPPVGQAMWLVTRGFATATIYDRSFIEASQKVAAEKHSPLDTSTQDFYVNGHEGRWYQVLGIAEERVDIGPNTFFVDVSASGDSPQVTEAFAGDVVNDFIAAN